MIYSQKGIGCAPESGYLAVSPLSKFEDMEENKMSKPCNNCVSEEKKVNVPFVVYQATAARQERQIRRMWIALIISVVLLFVSNAFWLLLWTQYDYESYELTANGESNANYIGQDGNIYNGGFGESETEN